MTRHDMSLVRCAALALVFTGCARRFDLTPAELARIESVGAEEPAAAPVEAPAAVQPLTTPATVAAGETAADPAPVEAPVAQLPSPALQTLRVYLKRRLRSYYPQEEVEAKFAVGTRRIIDRAVHRPRVRRISRNVPGKVILEDTQNGMRRLWITFTEDCAQATCAYGFVETELGRYSMVVIPLLEKFKEPRSYRRARVRRNLLKYARQRSLSEVNEVLAAVRRSGKALTIDLQIRKDRRRPTWKDRESLRGVEY